MKMKSWMSAVLAWSLTQSLFAQSDKTPIVDMTPDGLRMAEATMMAKIRLLIDAKKTMSGDEVKNYLVEPETQAIDLLPAKQEPLSREEIATVARAANLSVGYCYLCESCDDWHLSLAGGYAVAPDVIATCDHVIDGSMHKMREGYLIVADQEGNVYPVKSIVARSSVMDAALIRVGGANFKPLALNGAVEQGASAYCHSSPLGQLGFFSEGIVNRFFWGDTYKGGDKNSLEACRHLRVNFSTIWAPGSSGSAVLDQAGNAIGHVSEISGLGRGKNSQPMITLHTGIPAHGVRMLAEAAGDAGKIKGLAELEAGEKEGKRGEANDTKPGKTEE